MTTARFADRTAGLAEAFVELTGIMAAGYDIVDVLDRLLEHCVRLLDVDEAALVVVPMSVVDGVGLERRETSGRGVSC